MPNYFEENGTIIPFDKVEYVNVTSSHVYIRMAGGDSTLGKSKGDNFVKAYKEWLDHNWNNEISGKLDELSTYLYELKNYLIYR